MDRQKDIKTVRKKDRYEYRQTHIHTDTQTHRHTNRHTAIQTYRQTDINSDSFIITAQKALDWHALSAYSTFNVELCLKFR